MKDRNIFWGILFVLGAIGLIIGKLGFLSDINPFSLGFSIILFAIIIDSLFRLNYAGILFPIAFICIIYDEKLGITMLTPWTVLLAALFGSIGLSMIFPKKNKWFDVKSYYKSEKNTSILEEYESKLDEENFEEVFNDESNIKINSVFSAQTKYINNNKFVSADIKCKCSGLQVYFDNAIMAEDVAIIRLDISLSGLELYIPKAWNVENRTNVFIGGVGNERKESKEFSHTLILTGDIKLSGVEVYYI
ncbi:MAG: hypothetical protein HFJ13_03035 [Clostridium sp.]|uniref:LiaF transmembrane domain-containing protein n=1 Tax=Clostridium sp. TaxID=1506 RepID=UPI0025B9C37A|nr:hypothetical protein [Clostridium sp.]MCI9303099.1 hypothetical protein [Clostridium sp.]